MGTGGAVTLNGSEIRYRLASKSLQRNESARLMFHISGNLPQSIVFCVDGGEGEAADESMIACSSADIETAFTLKDATWQGRVARARIRIKANFASGAFAGDWEESELRLCAYRLSPSVSCSFTDESQLDARFGGFIEGKSFIKCLISVTLDREADPDVSVSLRSLSFNGASRPLASDECEIGYVPASGSVPYAVSVTDSHGEEGTVSGSVGIIRYASPCLTALVFERYGEGVDEQGNAVYYPDDGSPNIRVTAIGSVSTVNGLNAWTLSVLCSDGESEISALMAQGGDGRGISYAGDRTLFTAALSEQSDWNVTVTLSDCFESVSYRLFLPKADAIFDIEKGGVAVGMRSTGTRLAPLFEVAYPAVFHGDVSFPGIDSGWRQAALQGATEYGDSWRVMVRRVGSMVFMRGAAKLDSALESGAGGSDAGVKRLLTLESEFRPGYPMEFAVVPERSECYMHLRLMPSGALTLYNRSGYTVGPSVLIPLNLSFLKE